MARQSTEHKIVEFFQTTPLASANAIFGIVKGTMQNRNANQDAGPVAKRRKSGGRKPRSAAPADPAAPKARRGRKPKAQVTEGSAEPQATAEQQAAVAEIPVGEQAGAAV